MAYQAPDGTTYTSRDSYERARDLGYTKPVKDERRYTRSSQPSTRPSPQGFKAPDGRTYASEDAYLRASAIRAGTTSPQPQTSSPEATEIDTQQAAEEERTRYLLQQYGSQAVQEKYEVELKRPEGAARPVFIPEGTYDPDKTYGGSVIEYPTEVEGMSKEEVAAAVSQRIPGVIEESYQEQEQARRQWEADLALGMAASSPAVQQKAYESGLIGVEDAPDFTAFEGVKAAFEPEQLGKTIYTGGALGIGFTALAATAAAPLTIPIAVGLVGAYGYGVYQEYKATPPQQRDYFVGKEATEFLLVGGIATKTGKVAGRIISQKGFGRAKLTPEKYDIKTYTEPGGYGKPRKFKIDLTTKFKEIDQPVTTSAGGIVKVTKTDTPGITLSASEITSAVTLEAGGSVKPLEIGDVGLNIGLETGTAFPGSQVGFGGTIGRRVQFDPYVPSFRANEIILKKPRDTSVTAETMMIERGGRQFVLAKGMADYPGRLGTMRPIIPRMGFTGKGYGKGIIDRPAPEPLAKITEISTEAFNVGKVPEPTTRREDIMRGITQRAVQRYPLSAILFDPSPTRSRPSFKFDKLRSPQELYTPSVAAKINLTPIIATQRSQAAYKFKIKPMQKYATASALSTTQMMGQTAATSQSFKFDSMFDQRSKLTTKSLTKTRLETDTMTRTRTRTRTRMKVRRNPFRIKIPEFETRKGFGLGIGRRKSYKRRFPVFASPTAALFNIRATRKERLRTKFTGLELIGLR